MHECGNHRSGANKSQTAFGLSECKIESLHFEESLEHQLLINVALIMFCVDVFVLKFDGLGLYNYKETF